MIKIDDEEIGSLWEANKEKLEARIKKLTGRADLAEDLLQDVFLKVYPVAEQLDSSYAAKYLMRTATNTARDYRRRQRYWTMEYKDSAYLETPYDLYLRKERQDYYIHKVTPAVRSLPDKLKEAIELYMNDDSRTGAARKIGIPSTTLRSRQESALRSLRRKLEGSNDSDSPI